MGLKDLGLGFRVFALFWCGILKNSVSFLCHPSVMTYGGFLKIKGTLLGVPVVRIILFSGVYKVVLLFRETNICGSCRDCSRYGHGVPQAICDVLYAAIG